jgi:hypothetical protein
MNTRTALIDTHTGLVCKGLPATFTCTCIYRYTFLGRMMMNVTEFLFVRTELAERN